MPLIGDVTGPPVAIVTVLIFVWTESSVVAFAWESLATIGTFHQVQPRGACPRAGPG